MSEAGPGETPRPVERCCVCGRSLAPGEARYLVDRDVAICIPCSDEVRRPSVPNGEH